MSKITINKLRELVKKEDIHTVIVGFTDHYGRWMGKRFDANFFLDKIAKKGTHACNYLLTTDIDMVPLPGFKSSNWDKGYGDFHLAPDKETLRIVHWLPKTAAVIADVKQENGNPIFHSPRQVLKNLIQRLKKAGFDCNVATELEYYIYEDSFRVAAQKDYKNLQSVGRYREDYHLFQGNRTEGFHSEVRNVLKKSGISVEGTKGEWGIGQHELNVVFSDALEMADQHILIKNCLKTIADQMGKAITFMAKPFDGGAGSSCHLHLNLMKEDKNAFSIPSKSKGKKYSRVFEQFLAGWIRHTTEVMPFFAPTVNSYKRYQNSSWAPTGLGWSADNRTSGFRIVGDGEGLRIECRLPGADANPYLAIAAAIAAGLAGIAGEYDLPPSLDKNNYSANDLTELPTNLYDANRLFRDSRFAKSAFGEEVVEHYAHFYQLEYKAFQRSVTDWERKRYFEHI